MDRLAMGMFGGRDEDEADDEDVAASAFQGKKVRVFEEEE